MHKVAHGTDVCTWRQQTRCAAHHQMTKCISSMLSVETAENLMSWEVARCRYVYDRCRCEISRSGFCLRLHSACSHEIAEDLALAYSYTSPKYQPTSHASFVLELEHVHIGAMSRRSIGLVSSSSSDNITRKRQTPHTVYTISGLLLIRVGS